MQNAYDASRQLIVCHFVKCVKCMKKVQKCTSSKIRNDDKRIPNHMKHFLSSMKYDNLSCHKTKEFESLIVQKVTAYYNSLLGTISSNI